jgi:hypothetical protein
MEGNLKQSMRKVFRGWLLSGLNVMDHVLINYGM